MDSDLEIQYTYERFPLSGDGKVYLETGYNKSVSENNKGRLVIEKDGQKAEAIIDLDDIHTLALLFTNRADKFLQGGSRKVGVKYVPVEKGLLQKYEDYKKFKGRSSIHKSSY